MNKEVQFIYLSFGTPWWKFESKLGYIFKYIRGALIINAHFIHIVTCKIAYRVRCMGAMAYLVRKNSWIVLSPARSSSVQTLSLYLHFGFLIATITTHTTYLLRVVPSEIPTEHHTAACLSAPTKTSRGLTPWCNQENVEVWRWKTRHTASFVDTKWK